MQIKLQPGLLAKFSRDTLNFSKFLVSEEGKVVYYTSLV
jgi:glutathione peroxidase-family protein